MSDASSTHTVDPTETNWPTWVLYPFAFIYAFAVGMIVAAIVLGLR